MKNARPGADSDAPPFQSPPSLCTGLAPGLRAATGFAAGAAIMTLDGAIAVECLAPGDRIVTRNGGMRRLKAIHSQVHGDLRAVLITASALGHGRPEADVVLGPDQGILLRDWRAHTLYGRDSALIPASRLVDGVYVALAPRTLRTRLFRLQFDEDCVIYTNGLECGVSCSGLPD